MRWSAATVVVCMGLTCAPAARAARPRAGRMPRGTSAATAPASAVTLLSDVRVAGASVTLADLLPEQAPAALRERAQGINLGASPQPGIPRVMPRRELQALLARSPLTPAGLAIPPSVVIERDVPLVSRQSLLSLIQSALKGRSGFDARALTPAQILLPMPVYARPDEHMVIDAIEQDPYSSNLRFRVRFVNEPQRPAFYILAPVRVNTPVLVAEHSLHSGDILRAGDLRAMDAQGEQAARKLVGFRMMLNVPAGETVSRSMLAPLPLVVAGHPVLMTYRGNGYTLTSTVVALQSAAMGELITVRNPKNNATSQARVVGPGQVSPVKGAFHDMRFLQH